MIASKVICDDTYSNKSWCIVGQGMFALREINQMEREMCSYLEWILNVKPEELAEFEADVKRDYGTGGAKVGVVSSPPTTTTETSPSAASRPVAPVATTVAAPVAPAITRAISSSNPYPSPESSPPTPSHSDSSSPASSEPRTPPSQEDDDPAARNTIQGGRVASKGAPISSSNKVPSAVHAVQVKVVEERLPRSQSFAFASPAEW